MRTTIRHRPPLPTAATATKSVAAAVNAYHDFVSAPAPRQQQGGSENENVTEPVVHEINEEQVLGDLRALSIKSLKKFIADDAGLSTKGHTFIDKEELCPSAPPRCSLCLGPSRSSCSSP